MKKAIKLTLAALLAMCSTNLFGQKLGRIDMQALILSMPETAEMQKNLSAFGQELGDQLEAIRVEFNNKYEEYQKNMNTWSDSVRALKEKDLQDLQNRYAEFERLSQSDFAKKQEELFAPIQQKAVEAVALVSKAGAYLAVFDTSAGAMAYFDEAALTDVLPEVQKSMGITPGAAAAAAK